MLTPAILPDNENRSFGPHLPCPMAKIQSLYNGDWAAALMFRHRVSCKNSGLIGQTVSDQAKNGPRKSTVGGSSPETLSAGIKRTAGSHPKERVSGELPRALAHSRNSQCPPGEILCPGLVCGIPFAGMAPCGPLYSLQRVCRRQGLGRSRAFRIGEPMRYSPYRARKMKSELLHVSEL